MGEGGGKNACLSHILHPPAFALCSNTTDAFPPSSPFCGEGGRKEGWRTKSDCDRLPNIAVQMSAVKGKSEVDKEEEGEERDVV